MTTASLFINSETAFGHLRAYPHVFRSEESVIQYCHAMMPDEHMED
jgi:hypothetical protein